jgi:hypothetical protein
MAVELRTDRRPLARGWSLALRWFARFSSRWISSGWHVILKQLGNRNLRERATGQLERGQAPIDVPKQVMGK